MNKETEGDMAAAELAAEAERDNTPAPLPPCGPERDRLAAHAVGWMHWDRSWPWHPQRMQYLAPSTTDADALALLEAWATTPAATTRGYGHNRYEAAVHVVTLFKNMVLVAYATAPTLGDAATAAVSERLPLAPSWMPVSGWQIST